jgi:hypothetical protein
MKKQYLSPSYKPDIISFRAARTKLIKGVLNHPVEKLLLPLLPVMVKLSLGAYLRYGSLGGGGGGAEFVKKSGKSWF